MVLISNYSFVKSNRQFVPVRYIVNIVWATPSCYTSMWSHGKCSHLYL